MRHMELHILQSFPVSCLNRDDLNSPKTAIFGGVQRARVSSQSWKRAIRELAKEYCPTFQGMRTKLIVEPLRDALIAEGFGEPDALEKAKELANEIAKFDSETEKKKGKLQVKTLFFTSLEELKTLARAYQQTGDLKKARKALNADLLKDAADIALFGRMVANDHSLTVEGAAMFAHALSTHRVDNEIDFFSAVDEGPKPDGLEAEEDAGAGMMGTLEFNSATYYRFAAVNLDMLKDNEHLAAMSPSERKDVVRAFVRATLLAVPPARRNSMNAATVPDYVVGIVRKNGHPVQLVNAFEKPVRLQRGKGLLESSVEALKAEQDRLNGTWALNKDELVCSVIPDKTLAQFLDEVTAHVQ